MNADNLIPCYYRIADDNVYLIPAHLIIEFDATQSYIKTLHSDTVEWYTAIDNCDDVFSKYLVEGDIADIVLWIDIKLENK